MAYKPRTVLLASREHLCVNKEINENVGFALKAACMNAQKKAKRCKYYKNGETGMEKMPWNSILSLLYVKGQVEWR